jgi:hypothetical protein
MRGAIPPLPQYAFMVWYSVKKRHRDNFTFVFILGIREINSGEYRIPPNTGSVLWRMPHNVRGRFL